MSYVCTQCEAPSDPNQPNLDLVGPYNGPCGLCGGPDQRHRMYDAVVGRLHAGEGVEELAEDFEKPVQWVEAIAFDANVDLE